MNSEAPPQTGEWIGGSSRLLRIVALAIGVIALGLEAAVWADDGLLRARQEAGPFIVSVFTAPEPLRVGPVEVTVLVQSSGGAVLTDADVDVLLDSASRPIERRARATQDAASNKLAKTAVVDLPAAGPWTLTVSVRFDGDAATVTCLLPVAPASSRMSLAWPWLLVPPVVVALFALHQRLKRQRGMGGPGNRRTGDAASNATRSRPPAVEPPERCDNRLSAVTVDSGPLGWERNRPAV